MHEIMTAVCLLATAAVLISASVQDIRSREVSDVHWMIIGIAGIAAMFLVMISDAVTAGRLMVCAGSVMILLDILHERKCSKHADVLFYMVAGMMFIIPLITSFDDPFVRNSVTIPLCFVIFVAMFFGGIIKGGADVKCLIVLAMMFPSYPAMFGYPMISVPAAVMPMLFPFPLAVLFYASLLTVLAMLPIIFRNIIRGDTEMPNMFVGHRMPADAAEMSHVWLMDAPGSSDGKVWVIAKVPFIVPITAAVLFAAFVGNMIFMI